MQTVKSVCRHLGRFLLVSAFTGLSIAAANAQIGGPIDLGQVRTNTIILGPRDKALAVGTAEKVVRGAFGGSRAYRLQEQQNVEFREQINTDAKSGVAFRFLDGTSLSLGENAEIKIDEFVYEPNQNFLKGSMNVLKGTMRFVGSVARKEVEIRTPESSIGIRGTAFNLRVASGASEVEVLSGEIELTSGGQRQTVRPNEFYRVTNGTIQRTAAPPAFRAALTQIDASLGAPVLATASTAGLTEIKNSSGRVAGYTLTRADGRVDALDTGRRLIGYFDPISNSTYAWNGRRLASGNLAQSLASGQR